MTEFENRIRDSFSRQTMMQTLGARLQRIAEGRVAIEAPILPGARQQQGAGHAGLAFSIGDSAAGYSVWYLCLPRLPVVASGSVQLATPAAAALGGILLLGEPAGWRLAGASALILAGIALTLLKRRQAGSITPKA